mgnify:CR=1 FL=1
MYNKKILRLLLTFILFVAGVAHFIIPEEFIPAMPDYLPYHLEMIYLTGLIELIFVITINVQKQRKVSCYLLSAYFVVLLPAHIHVSMNSIPMFGISSPFLLWGRTIFQIVFIIWPFLLLEKDSTATNKTLPDSPL